MMNTHTGKIQSKLEESGVEFLPVLNGESRSYIATLDGQTIAKASTRSECIKAAAKALGEPL